LVFGGFDAGFGAGEPGRGCLQGAFEFGDTLSRCAGVFFGLVVAYDRRRRPRARRRPA
jgi:hypothetical protein